MPGTGRTSLNISMSFSPTKRSSSFHYRGLRALDGRALGRGADRRRAAWSTTCRRASEAEARRRGRLQHRQRHRRDSLREPQTRRPHPRDAVRFAEGSRAVHVSVAADRPFFGHEIDAASAAPERRTCRLRLSRPGADEIVPVRANRRLRERLRTLSSIRRSLAPAIMTFMRGRISRMRCARPSTSQIVDTRGPCLEPSAPSIFLKSKDAIRRAAHVNDPQS